MTKPRLNIDGEVANPTTISFDDLAAFPADGKLPTSAASIPSAKATR